MFQNLSIFEKTYELILWVYPAVNKFPKKQRFVLGQHISNTTLKILEGINAGDNFVIMMSGDNTAVQTSATSTAFSTATSFKVIVEQVEGE